MNQLRHIGIIMDGNGRWAERSGRPRIFGHIKGARIAKRIITECTKRNVEYLTLYAFSTENWLRPEQEVNFLMTLLQRYLQKETATLVKQNIRFTAIGQLNKLPSEVIQVINQTKKATQNCTGMNLVFALSYGAKSELVEATKTLALKVSNGELSPEQINEDLLSHQLSSYPSPDIDLIIRTSGEKRLSNFMLWQSAYAELYFSETLWPDFNEAEFNYILSDFQKRNRKYGSVLPTQKKDKKINAELSH